MRGVACRARRSSTPSRASRTTARWCCCWRTCDRRVGHRAGPAPLLPFPRGRAADAHRLGALRAGQRAARDSLRGGIARYRDSGVRLDFPCYLGIHADAALRIGDLRQARGAVDEAFASMEPGRRHNLEPELLRLRALLRRHEAADTAGTLAELRVAVDRASAQSARALELRALADVLETGEPAETAAEADGLKAPLETSAGRAGTWVVLAPGARSRRASPLAPAGSVHSRLHEHRGRPRRRAGAAPARSPRHPARARSGPGRARDRRTSSPQPAAAVRARPRRA